MKILDRYISTSVVAAFLSGVTMFMVLLCAMDLLKGLIDLIAKQGVPAGLALMIFAYKIPGMLVYAFPMAVLLGILLTFGRMSAESEMVAIRAAGVSFVRIIVPTLFIALLITGFTFWISNVFAPYASKKSLTLEQMALHTLKSDPLVIPIKDKNNEIRYTVQAGNIDFARGTMRDVTILYYQHGVPAYFWYADSGTWLPLEGRWEFKGAYPRVVAPELEGFRAIPQSKSSEWSFASNAMALDKSPLDLQRDKKDPNDFTSDELRAMLAKLKKDDSNPQETARMATRLAQRYSTPFTCLVFALIGAPLGLRHHRTSSAVGLGVSLLVIFVYYFINVYMTTFGDSGKVSPLIAAWTPNVLGTLLGIWLIARANR